MLHARFHLESPFYYLAAKTDRALCRDKYFLSSQCLHGMFMFSREQVCTNPSTPFQCRRVIADVSLLIMCTGIDDSNQGSVNDSDEAEFLSDSASIPSQ